MKNVRHHLPSLNALSAFEAAGRLSGFTRAAEELRISQPAITRHIKGLEESLGVALFSRAHNRVVLTEAGLRLWHAVNTGFSDIAEVSSSIARTGGSAALSFSTHAGFGQQWLMPRLESLREALEGRPINLAIIDGDTELNRGDFDMGVRHGKGNWAGQVAKRLCDEVVVPVVSPRFLERHPHLREAQADAFLDLPLIHMDEGDKPWMTWAIWFRHCGLHQAIPRAAIRYNHYPMVIQQVLEGAGVGLGWKPLVNQMLNSEVLIAVGPEVQRKDSGWWLVWPEGASDVDRLRTLDWFQREMAW